jgi:hypothetical protein
MKGWCFLYRVNGGGLYITRMFGDYPALPGISLGAAAEGYHIPVNFTVMQALYYLSALAETSENLPETSINGIPGEVILPLAGNSSTAAPRIQQPQPPPPAPAAQDGFGGFPQGNFGGGGGYYGVQVLGGYDQAYCCQYHDKVNYRRLQFEPWNKENFLGPKNWIARALLPDKTEQVILKLWDGWKSDADARDHEALIYLHLRPLWGKCIPSLRVKTPFEYFHALIIEYVKVLYQLLN